ncbi:unnamed protein product [Closterium sp. NIES-54]
MVFPVAKKSEVTSTLIRWLLATEGTRGSHVRCLHSDRGGEFRSGVLAGFCGEQGIRQTCTLHESPQQNGFAERRICLSLQQPSTLPRQVTVDSVGVGAGGAATGSTRSGGASSRGAGAGGAGACGASSRGAGVGGCGKGCASSGGARAGGAGTRVASFRGAGAGGASFGGASGGGTGTGGASSRGAGAGGTDVGGAGTEETGAGGSPTTSPTARPHRHDTRFHALRWLEREEQERVEQERQEL